MRQIRMSGMSIYTPAQVPTKISQQDAKLIATLHQIGVKHIALPSDVEMSELQMSPKDLLRSLAASHDPYIRPSLVLVLLLHPTYGLQAQSAVRSLNRRLNTTAATELKLYYQAASYLQGEYEVRIKAVLAEPAAWMQLPDYFSRDLGVTAASSIGTDAKNIHAALTQLQNVHRQTTGMSYNYVAEYRGHVDLLLRYLS